MNLAVSWRGAHPKMRLEFGGPDQMDTDISGTHIAREMWEIPDGFAFAWGLIG